MPTIFARVLEYAKANDIALQSERLRFIAVGGMPLDLTLKAKIEDAFGLQIGNSYGMTEMAPITRSPGATVGSTAGEPQPESQSGSSVKTAPMHRSAKLVKSGSKGLT